MFVQKEFTCLEIFSQEVRGNNESNESLSEGMTIT